MSCKSFKAELFMTIPICGIVIALGCTSMVTNEWVRGTSKYIGGVGTTMAPEITDEPPGTTVMDTVGREDATSTTTVGTNVGTEGTVTYNFGLFGGHKLEEGRGSQEEEILYGELRYHSNLH